jgi:predicted membrane protein
MLPNPPLGPLSPPPPPRQNKLQLTPQFFLGLGVIILGVLFTLENLGIAHAEDYLRYWPVLLIAIGLTKVYQSRDGVSGAASGFIFAGIGTWLLLEETAVIKISFWELWPLLLVFFGTYLVWQGMTGPRGRQVRAEDTNSVVNATAILGGVARGNNAPNFRGGSLTAVMGGCELDLRHAAIDGEAIIDVFTMWGGIEIRVPEDWTVVSKIVPVLGGVDDKTRPPQGTSRHRLVLRGFVIMAGVEVKN